MIVVGVDPSSTATGIAVIDDDRLILAETLRFNQMEHPERQGKVVSRILELCSQYNPVLAGVEQIFVGGHKNYKSALKLSAMVGAAAGALAHCGVEVRMWLATEWRAIIVGTRSNKDAAVRTVQLRWNLQESSHSKDATEAIGIAEATLLQGKLI